MKRGFLLFFTVCVLLATLFYFSVSLLLSRGSFTVLSPLAEIHNKTLQNNTYEFWKPNKADAQAERAEPQISALSALTYDLTTERYLYQKDIETRRPMASLTKIVTAIIALEHDKLSKKIRISETAVQAGENAMGLEKGELLSLEELLYGLMLPSGNDAAEAIAEGSTLGRRDFVLMMNKKVQDLGLSNTNFTNPSGLEGDGNQYSTANDLLVITRYALKNPDFAKIVSTYEYQIPVRAHNKAYHLFNETNLLTTYPGVKGVKIGFTWEAGHCLVTYLEYEDHQIIGVLLNSQNRRQEMKDLLDYSLKELGINPPNHE